MTIEERMVILKADLQLITDSNDEFLKFCLTSGEAAIAVEGIKNDNSAAYEACVISYAAYLFRKRAASTAGGKDSETGMPRFLRWQMNNLLMSQKAGAGT